MIFEGLFGRLSSYPDTSRTNQNQANKTHKQNKQTKTPRRHRIRHEINPKPKFFIFQLLLFWHCNSKSIVEMYSPSQLYTLKVFFPPLIYLYIWFPRTINDVNSPFSYTCRYLIPALKWFSGHSCVIVIRMQGPFSLGLPV